MQKREKKSNTFSCLWGTDFKGMISIPTSGTVADNKTDKGRVSGEVMDCTTSHTSFG